MSASDDANGYYVLQTWASVAQVSPTTVTQNFKTSYGADSITAIGQAAGGINFNTLMTKFREIQDSSYDSDSVLSPKKVDINQALLDTGGTLPPTSTIVATGVEAAASEIGSGIFSGLKWLLIAVVLGATAYLVIETGALKGAVKRA